MRNDIGATSFMGEQPDGEPPPDIAHSEVYQLGVTAPGGGAWLLWFMIDRQAGRLILLHMRRKKDGLDLARLLGLNSIRDTDEDCLRERRVSLAGGVVHTASVC